MLRVKRVQIKGFKTFAHAAELVFDQGMTAIVGPNGCGKSNVADAVRWCLGEQSFGLLRSRKTVDVIFSGSDRRARLGMASVSLVLDNSDGELNIDFSEVEITRRAYRDGDNEYLLNGQRVRLQDVTQLLAPSGLGNRAYVVIGQGLIDRVLSLKPEERRTLFEEAAGITGYQQKRTVALRRLDATQQNLERVYDIIAELAPQLRYLKRQAERARERSQIEEDLEGLLHTWHGYQWHRAIDRLNEARHKAEVDQRSAGLRRERLNSIHKNIDSLRSRRAELRSRVDEQEKVVGDRRRQLDEVGRRLAVAEERLRHLVERSEELAADCAELKAGREAGQTRLVALRSEFEEAEPLCRRALRAVEQIQVRLAEQQRDRQQREQSRRESQAALNRIGRRIAERHSMLEQMGERLSAGAEARDRLTAELQTLRQDAERAEAALSRQESDTAALDAQLSRNQAQAAARAASVSTLERSLREREEIYRLAARRVDRMQARLELLQRLRSESAGYGSGVRAVLQAARDGGLTGILGTVASQLEVDPRLERATEAALGGALQNLIAETWREAHGAIEFLKRSRSGRATFLPLDRLRSDRPIPAPDIDGIVGNAAELVRYKDNVSAAVRQLLQRVWIADDLAAARRALDARRSTHSDTGRNGRGAATLPLPTVVTLEGEIIRPSGAVTGGESKTGPPAALLARKREARELPAELAAVREEAETAAGRTQSLRKQIDGERRAMLALEEEERKHRQQAQKLRSSTEQARLQADRARQAVEWHERMLEQSGKDLDELKPQVDALQTQLETAAEERKAAALRAGQAEAEATRARPEELLSQLADLRAEAAAAEAQLNSKRSLIEEQGRTLKQLDSQYQSKIHRLENLQQEAGQLRNQIDEVSGNERAYHSQLARLEGVLGPWESNLRLLAKEQEQAESEERAVQQSLVQVEAAWNSSRLALQRAEDRLDSLRREIRQDFGLAEMAEADGLAYQPPLPWHALVAQLPVVHQLPANLRDEVKETRSRLQRLSNVNPEAPREYEKAADRFGFLQTQSKDLEEAARDLRKIIGELDTRMESTLRSTFDAVSKEFTRYFKLLLPGGRAEVRVTDPDDILNTGIEIFARPPGKRPQSLDLLSGGERSLTASALVFAILRVSPTPFCILDEVDATLDEANVDRFRDALESLSEQTQFIVITHNRRTLEGANAIYGITMGDDGVSRVISLQLDGDEIAEVAEEPLQPAAAVTL